MYLYQYAKIQAFLLLCSKSRVDLKILQSDWPRPFWSIPWEPDFSQVWDLCKNTTINISFLYRPNLEKIKD